MAVVASLITLSLGVACGLIVQMRVSRVCIRDYCVSPVVGGLGALLGGMLARGAGLPRVLAFEVHGGTVSVLWAVAAATLAAFVTARLQLRRDARVERGLARPRRMDAHAPAGGPPGSASGSKETPSIQWARFEVEARVRWAKVTDADWRLAGQDLHKLACRIQERHGVPLEMVARQLGLLMFRFRDKVAPGLP